MCSLIRTAPHQVIKACRSCNAPELRPIMAFGDTPIADRLVPSGYAEPEFTAPLTLMLCATCGLCQIRETVEPDVLFGKDYPYYSSVSPALVSHFTASARAIIERYGLGEGDLVIEPASNDGYMLSVFRKAGLQVLGVDPAAGPVSVARKRGVETIHDFFTLELANRLVDEGRRAKVVLANNVLAHVANPRDFVSGVSALLADDGIAVLEFPYLVDLVEKRAFDTIYHQHLLYLSATSVSALLETSGLHLVDVERTNVHGGSLRITASKVPGRTPRLEKMLRAEEAMEISDPAYFDAFRAGVEQMRKDVAIAMDAYRKQGKKVMGYGAAAKATTLLHYFGLTQEDLRAIYDKSEWKQGFEMPVVRIPIADPAGLATDKPDVVLILAWNFAREIMAENTAFFESGGTFIVPVPKLRQVTLTDAGASL